jgi:hypothetical protein
MSLSVMNGIFLSLIFLGSMLNLVIFNEEIFILMDFCLFMTFAYKMAGDMIAKELDDRITRIQNEYTTLRDLQIQKNEVLKETHQIRASICTSLTNLFEYTEAKLEQTSYFTQKTLEVNSPKFIIQKFNFIILLEKQVFHQLHLCLANYVTQKQDNGCFAFSVGSTCAFPVKVEKSGNETSFDKFLLDQIDKVNQSSSKDFTAATNNAIAEDLFLNLSSSKATGFSNETKQEQLAAFAKSLFKPYAAYKWVSPSLFTQHTAISKINLINISSSLINDQINNNLKGSSTLKVEMNFNVNSIFRMSRQNMILRSLML